MLTWGVLWLGSRVSSDLLATNDSKSKTCECSEVDFYELICGRTWNMKVWRNPPSNLRQVQQLAYKEWARIPADGYRKLTESDFHL